MQSRLKRLMPALLITAGTLFAVNALTLFAADEQKQVYVTPKEAAEDADFQLQGEYVGKNVGIQVVALGKGEFKTVTYRGGLPGAGWNETEKQEVDEDTEGVKDLIDVLKLKKIERTSPTMGIKPPKGAVVLFDGTQDSVDTHWKAGAKLSDDSLLEQGVTSVDQFSDFSMHIEFRLPYMPAARGQGRGNSGIYYQGRFETQMLDSFGLEGKDNECGGLYTIKAPDVNMCLPPLSWQTYDIEFTAARFDGDKKVANARVTVKHNGVVVQQDVELPKTTTAAPNKEGPEPGPIYLQNHGNPVRYRNIWVLPRDLEQEARRPIVPGFERFHASSAGNPAVGGRLLLGELNCTACHQASQEIAAYLLPKQAPILDDVGKRVQPEAMLKFLADPHGAKPGTMMPDLLAHLPPAEKAETVLALVNFLNGAASVPTQNGDPQAAQRGEKLFREVGCVACHLPRNGTKVSTRTSIPLGALDKKYSIPSLAAFLQDPHKVRPSGRMPSFNLDTNAARDVACYLIGNVDSRPKNPNMKFAVYHGNWGMVPNFDELKPVRTGESAGLDLTVAGRTNDFGVRFEGFLKVEKEGDYTFHLGSDDGSLLFIDGKKVADSDGVHPHTVNTGRTKLTAGLHPVRIDYMQGGGEWTLSLEYEGPGIRRQDAAAAIQMTEQGNPMPAPVAQDEEPPFMFNSDLAESGRKHFVALGCANCHQLKEQGKTLVSTLAAPKLDQLDPAKGCVANMAGVVTTPDYDLNNSQQAALTAALSSPVPTEPETPAEQIAHTMTAFNCYACHARAKVGGPERDRNPLFLTTIPEMGDEGRVPPPLDGVADKLNEDWLKNVMQNGANDRPYMLTRMPKFGMQNIGHLIPAFVSVDQKTESEIPLFDEPDYRVKANGRHLVGDKALSCIKCHVFGPHKSAGIQSINLQTMTRRLREDWFHRYMLNPEAYRPGTRMPTGFPDGVASVKDVYDGKPNLQLAAIWMYLKDAEKAGIPDGLIANVIELVPEKEPIIYRNFLEGLSPRGIAVGYPERAHLAWDANRLSLSLVWHGRFIDAGKHWEGRGPGNQTPLGDHVMKLEESAPFATLDSPNGDWPSGEPKERGFRFKGYRLDKERRPHFNYTAEGFSVEDFPKPTTKGDEGAFERTLTITAPDSTKNLYFRAARGETIEKLDDGSYLVNGAIRIRLQTAGEPFLRESGGKQELLVPVIIKAGEGRIVQEIVW